MKDDVIPKRFSQYLIKRENSFGLILDIFENKTFS
jgi:hypothetical protein